MWQKSSVFSHESDQRNVAGHLIDKNVFKTTRSFCYMFDNMNVSLAFAWERKHETIGSEMTVLF